jgi:hypothetical protein
VGDDLFEGVFEHLLVDLDVHLGLGWDLVVLFSVLSDNGVFWCWFLNPFLKPIDKPYPDLIIGLANLLTRHLHRAILCMIHSKCYRFRLITRRNRNPKRLFLGHPCRPLMLNRKPTPPHTTQIHVDLHQLTLPYSAAFFGIVLLDLSQIGGELRLLFGEDLLEFVLDASFEAFFGVMLEHFVHLALEVADHGLLAFERGTGGAHTLVSGIALAEEVLFAFLDQLAEGLTLYLNFFRLQLWQACLDI